MKKAAKLTSLFYHRHAGLAWLIGLLVIMSLSDGTQAQVDMLGWQCSGNPPAVIAIGSAFPCRINLRTTLTTVQILVKYDTTQAYVALTAEPPPTNPIGSAPSSSGSTVTPNPSSSAPFILKHLSVPAGTKVLAVRLFGMSSVTVQFGIYYCPSPCQEGTGSVVSVGSSSSVLITSGGLQTVTLSTELDGCTPDCYLSYTGPVDAIAHKTDSSSMYVNGGTAHELKSGTTSVRFDVQAHVRNETYRTHVKTNVTYDQFKNYTMMFKYDPQPYEYHYPIYVFPAVYITINCPEQDIIVAEPTFCHVTVSRPATIDVATLSHSNQHNTGEFKTDLPTTNMTTGTISPYTYYNDTFTVYGIIPWLPGKTKVAVGLYRLPYGYGSTWIYPRQDVWYEYYCDKSAAVYEQINCTLYIKSERTYVLFYYSVYVNESSMSLRQVEATFDITNKIGQSEYNASRNLYQKEVPFQMMFEKDATYQVNLTMNSTGLTQYFFITVYPIFKMNCSTCPGSGEWGKPREYEYNVFTVNRLWTNTFVDYGDSLLLNQFNCSLSLNKTYIGSRNLYSLDFYGNESLPVITYTPNEIYLLLNTEFEKEIYLEKIQFVGTQLGWINIQLLNPAWCGGAGVSCLDFIDNVYVNLSYADIMDHTTIHRTWRYNINTTGLNEIVVNDYNNHYPAGCFLAWWPDATGGGRIEALETEPPGDISRDYIMVNNSATRLKRLGNQSTQLVFNVVVVGEVYYVVDKCNDSRYYFYEGEFDITYTNNSVKERLKKDVDVDSRDTSNQTSCINPMQQGNHVTCTYRYTNLTVMPKFSFYSPALSISSVGSCLVTNTDTFSSAFGGSLVPSSSEPIILGGSKYLLLSAISVTDSKLISIELNAKATGSIIIQLIRITGCSSYSTCYKLIQNSTSYGVSFTQINSFTFTVTPGNYTVYNFSLPSTYDKGVIPLLTTATAVPNQIHLERSSLMRDFQVVGSNTTAIKLGDITADATANWRLCARVWFEKAYYSLSPTNWTSPQIVVLHGTFNFTIVTGSCQAEPARNYSINSFTLSVTNDPMFTTTTTTAAPFQVESMFSMAIYNATDPAQLDYLIALLGSNYTGDLSGCLSNCSNQGQCALNTDGLYFCDCDTYFSGTRCQSDSRPCSSTPCLNNGNCTNVADPSTGVFSTYSCDCGSYFFGTNCELYTDLCSNFSCSGHGTCKETSEGPNCTCYLYYTGTNCEIVSPTMKAIQAVVSIASIIAIIFICSVYLILLLSDLHTHFFLNSTVIKKKLAKPKINKFQYKDFGEEANNSDAESEMNLPNEISYTPASQNPAGISNAAQVAAVPSTIALAAATTAVGSGLVAAQASLPVQPEANQPTASSSNSATESPPSEPDSQQSAEADQTQQSPEEATEQNNQNEAQEPEKKDDDVDGSQGDDEQEDNEDEEDEENEEDDDDDDDEEDDEDEEDGDENSQGLEDIDEEPEAGEEEQPTNSEQTPPQTNQPPENPIPKVEPSTDVNFHDFYP